jgi:predicted ribonuclease YlaK
MVKLPKAIYMFNAIAIKIPMTVIAEIKKINPKVNLEAHKTANTKAILSKKSNTGNITVPDFKLYYRTIAIKTARYWQKNRYEDLRNSIEDPDMILHSCAHLIFDKGAKNL